MSIATLLSQHHHVTAVDIIPEKVEMINNRKSPIQDDYIEKYLAEKDLDLTATLDAKAAYSDADFVVIAAPTNYDSHTQHFDTSAVEAVIKLVMEYNPNAIMVIKSTIPVGYTASVREKFNSKNIIFSPEFLRESKALYVLLDSTFLQQTGKLMCCLYQTLIVQISANDDTGRIQIVMQCVYWIVYEKVQRLKLQGFTNWAMQHWTFANNHGQNPQMQLAQRYVDHWPEMREKNVGLLLWGGVGTGKSFMAGCIANALMEQEVAVCMTNFARIMNELNNAFSGRNEVVDKLCGYLLLVIDDFGMERGTEYALEQMFA